MNYLYGTVRVVEILVMVLCGFRLITQTFEMRWDYWWAKVLLGFGLVCTIAILIINGMMFSFSTMDYIFGLVCCVILSVIFYDMSLRHVFVYNMLYWQNLLLFHLILLIVVSVLENKNVREQILDVEDVNLIYIVGMCAIIFFLLYLDKMRQGKYFIALKGKRNFIYVFSLMIIEWIAIDGLLVNDIMFLSNDWRNAVAAASFFVAVTSISIILLIYNSFVTEKYQKKLLELNQNMVRKQYDYMQESYDDKRRQVHNALHQYTFLKEYLVMGKIDEACYYLEELQNKSKNMRRNPETGISSIDFILSFKRNEAEKRDIRIDTEVNAFFCPFERDDLCILLGNLIDNAIEASQVLMKEQRRVFIEIRTANNIFMLKIENQYIGGRKIIDGSYQTTKANDDIHGLGIESCRMIVNRYNGTLEIEDNGNTFSVEVTIFQDGIK